MQTPPAGLSKSPTHHSLHSHWVTHHGTSCDLQVLVFRLLRTALCEALAHVQHAGMLLYLKEASRPNSTGVASGVVLRVTYHLGVHRKPVLTR